jgi:hypothetical protein
LALTGARELLLVGADVDRAPFFGAGARSASGQPAHAAANFAIRPSPNGRSAMVFPAGQLTVPPSRSIVNASLENRPPGETGGCTQSVDGFRLRGARVPSRRAANRERHRRRSVSTASGRFRPGREVVQASSRHILPPQAAGNRCPAHSDTSRSGACARAREAFDLRRSSRVDTELEALFYFDGSGLYVTGAALGRSSRFDRDGVCVRIALPRPEHVRDSRDPESFGRSARRTNWNKQTGEIIAAMVEKLEVRVQVTRDDNEPPDAPIARAIPVAAGAAGLFLASARTLAGQYWLPPSHEQPRAATYGMLVRAGSYDEVDERARLFVGGFEAHAISRDRAADGDAIDEVFAKTSASEEPPTDAVLFADAHAALHAGRRDTASAVLYAAMAAELKIKQALLRNARQVLDAVLENPRDLPTATGQLLGKTMKAAVGKSLAEEDPQLYNQVTEQLFPLRNHVVHRGSRPGPVEARTAIDIMTRLFRWFDSV